MPLSAPLLFLDGRRDAVTHFIQPGTGFTAPAVVTVTDEFGTAGQRYEFEVKAVKVLSPTRLLVCVTCTPPTAARDTISVTVSVTTGGGTQSLAAVPAAVLNQEPIIDWTRVKKQTVTPVLDSQSVLFLPILGGVSGVMSPVGSNAIGRWSVADPLQQEDRLVLQLTCVQEPFAPAPGMVPTASFLTALLITLVGTDASTIKTPPIEITYIPDPFEEPTGPIS